jgi:hypothetical protein
MLVRGDDLLTWPRTEASPSKAAKKYRPALVGSQVMTSARHSTTHIVTALFLVLCLAESADSKELITLLEASLPDTSAEKAVFPGPKMVQLSPDPNAMPTRSPLRFRLRFETRGSRIDLTSLKVTYLKRPLVDLTNRVKEYSSASGIDMPNAEVPPGDHVIRIELSDADGLVGRTEILLRVRN